MSSLMAKVGSKWIRSTAVMWMDYRLCSSPAQAESFPCKATRDPRRRAAQVEGNQKFFTEVILFLLK